jgi:8-oxo-dGTP pyrophosphatase MutT (NUDIX family)
MLVVSKPPTLSSFYNVNLALVKLALLLVQFRLTKSHVGAAFRELHEETGLTLSLNDLTMLSDAPVRIA